MNDNGGATVHCNDLPWLPLAPKVFVKVIKLMPDSGEFSVMIRAEPGGVLPRHRHLESAEIFMLKGSGEHRQTGPFAPGDYISEHKGAIHDALTFPEATELLMVCKGASAFLGPQDETLYLMDVPMLQQLAARAMASPSSAP